MSTRVPVAPRREQLALAGAVAWSALLVPLAFILPVETPSGAAVATAGPTMVAMEPLVRVQGHRVLVVVATPLVLSLVVVLSTVLSECRGWAVAGGLAWMVSVALTAAAVVGTVTFLIGIYVLPVGTLLVVSCGLRRSRHRALPDWSR